MLASGENKLIQCPDKWKREERSHCKESYCKTMFLPCRSFCSSLGQEMFRVKMSLEPIINDNVAFGKILSILAGLRSWAFWISQIMGQILSPHHTEKALWYLLCQFSEASLKVVRNKAQQNVNIQLPGWRTVSWNESNRPAVFFCSVNQTWLA